jgi:hypothetical protein
MIARTSRLNRDSLLKVRVRPDTKERVIKASRDLDIDQSTLVRRAVNEFIAAHCNAT